MQFLATVASSQLPERTVVEAAQRAIAAYLNRSAELLVFVSPVTRLDAVSPPTAQPGGGATAQPSRPILNLPTAVPTAAPVPTATVALPTPTAAPPPIAAIPSRPPGRWVAAAITGGLGLNLRAAPAQASPIIHSWPYGTPFFAPETEQEVIGPQERWTQVVGPDGLVGWAASEYLVPYRGDIADSQDTPR